MYHLENIVPNFSLLAPAILSTVQVSLNTANHPQNTADRQTVATSDQIRYGGHQIVICYSYQIKNICCTGTRGAP